MVLGLHTVSRFSGWCVHSHNEDGCGFVLDSENKENELSVRTCHCQPANLPFSYKTSYCLRGPSIIWADIKELKFL